MKNVYVMNVKEVYVQLNILNNKNQLVATCSSLKWTPGKLHMWPSVSPIACEFDNMKFSEGRSWCGKSSIKSQMTDDMSTLNNQPFRHHVLRFYISISGKEVDVVFFELPELCRC